MSSIVLELQQAAKDKRQDLGEILRQSVILASKLRLEDFLLWAKRELDGYGPSDELPHYRVVPCDIKAFNPYNGQWVPFVCTSEPHEVLRKRPIRQRVAELQDLVNGQDGILVVPMPEEVAYKLMRLTGAPTPPVFIVCRTSVLGILDAVRNVILDRSLKLEADGVLGTGVAFTTGEKDAAKIITLNFMRDNYSAGQAGAMGPEAHSHDMEFRQVAAEQLKHLDMATLTVELESLRHEMRKLASKPDQDIAVGQIAAAEAAAQKGDASSVSHYLRSAGKWAFDIATKIGVTVASEAIKKSTGL